MNEELQIAAAEYVLGTLPADERARLAGQLETDGELREAVRWWRERLSVLDAAVPDATLPATLWPAIERAMSSRQVPIPDRATGNVVQLRRRLAVWRSVALTTGALAAGLAGLLVFDSLSVPALPEGGRFVAVVDTEGREPALIAEVDTGSRTILIRSLAAQVPTGRSLELWHIPEGERPLSLGVLQVGSEAQRIADRVAAGPVDGVIAVTVEPQGGSPNGDPTGPVVYSGRLIPLE